MVKNSKTKQNFIFDCFYTKWAGIDAPAASVDLVKKLKIKQNHVSACFWTTWARIDAHAASADLVNTLNEGMDPTKEKRRGGSRTHKNEGSDPNIQR